MPAPSAQTLQRLANETGYQAGTLEKVLRLLDLLAEIARDTVLAEKFALKGGTALNVFHLALDRLSVDIDLNYVGTLDREVMQAERPELEAALSRLLLAQGYAVRRQPDEHAGGKWLTRYASALGGNAALEIDLNYMSRQPLFGAARMDSVELGGVCIRDTLVVDIREIVAGKIVALVNRRAARDLFDARRILAIDELDWRSIKAAVLAIGASGRRDWRTASVDDIGGDARDLRQKLMLCLPRGYFEKAGGADAWIDETVTNCRERLKFLFDWASGERAFLDTLLGRGEIDVASLDVDDGLRGRIAIMPMLAWKAQNVRAQRNSRRKN